MQERIWFSELFEILKLGAQMQKFFSPSILFHESYVICMIRGNTYKVSSSKPMTLYTSYHTLWLMIHQQMKWLATTDKLLQLWNFWFYFYLISFVVELNSSEFFFSLRLIFSELAIAANDLCVFHNASDKYDICMQIKIGLQRTRWLVYTNGRWFNWFNPNWFVFVLIQLIQFNQPNTVETGKKDERSDFMSTFKYQKPHVFYINNWNMTTIDDYNVRSKKNIWTTNQRRMKWGEMNKRIPITQKQQQQYKIHTHRNGCWWYGAIDIILTI